MSTHAPLAPSASSRWIACPGSVRLTRNLPDVETEHAALGTFAHEIAAQCLTEGVDAVEKIGEIDLVHECDAEMAEHIQTYLDAVRAVPGKLFVEARVHIADGVWGTADAIVYVAENLDRDRVGPVGQLHVFDFKYGAGIFVPVENNTQLGCYALGALYEFSDRWQDIAEVHLHIVQPRHHLGGHHVSVVAVETIESWGDLGLRPAIEATKRPNAPLVSGEHCRFCDAKPTCPQLRADALASAQHLFAHPEGADDVYLADDETGLVEQAKSPPAPSDLTPDQVSAAISMFPTIELWMKAVREHAYSLANKGTVVPGHKLVDKRGNRKWRSVADVETFLGELYNINIYAPPRLSTPAQMEKLLDKDERSIVESLASKPILGTALVPDSDTRPALNAGDVFTDLPSTEGDA